jgi:hypothetical protein
MSFLLNLTPPPLGFSVKDFKTRCEIIRCNSSGDLYTISLAPVAPSHQAFISSVTPAPVWHARLGHPGPDVLNKLQNSSSIVYNTSAHRMCHACQLGKHVRLPFRSSVSSSTCPFELLHCDVWTSPITSTPGFKYYLVLLDDFTHFSGFFLSNISLMSSPHSLTFILMFAPSFIFPLKSSMLTMGPSS